MSEELYERISESRDEAHGELRAEAEEGAKNWLLFSSGGKTYAVDASKVREILRNSEIYPLPFTPAYVKGVLNFYGKPLAVVDFSKLQNLEESRAKLFMVIDGDDDFAVQIDDIYEFFSGSDVERQVLSSSASGINFSRAIEFESSVAPVLDVENLATVIRENLESL